MQFPRSAQLMRDVGWFPFCEILQGYNIQVTQDFIKNYRDGVVDFKILKVTADEESIVEAIGVPAQVENGLNNKNFTVIMVNLCYQGLRS